MACGLHKFGLYLVAANAAVSEIEDGDSNEEDSQGSGLNNMRIPTLSLATHLRNDVVHKGAPVTHVIADVRIALCKISLEYLDARGFNSHQFHVSSKRIPIIQNKLPKYAGILPAHLTSIPSSPWFLSLHSSLVLVSE